jgi:glycosyltransferase involved in cell wall biosynthesis
MSILCESITYDLIVVSATSSEHLKQMTQQCIDTARADGADLNIIVVETFKKYQYQGANKIILYKGLFNYNRALNLGLKSAKGDVHILVNNDIIFHKGWSRIGYDMIANGFDSASALSSDQRQKHFQRGDLVYPGYTVGIYLVGWCIFLTKECLKKLGQLDETFDFWYSDNVYSDQLIEHKLRHGLFCNVQVDHATSQTLQTKSGRERRRLSFGATNNYLRLKKLRNAS